MNKICQELLYDTITDIHHTRDIIRPIPLRVMASSAMGLNLGYIWVFGDHTRKTNALTIFAHRMAFNV